MRYPAAAKLEIIRLVEGSHLPVRRTLRHLGIPPATFYLYGLPLVQAFFGLRPVGQFAYLYPASWGDPPRPNGKSARTGLNRWAAYEWPR